MKKDNKGFSLVELIVVIAIMGVFAGMLTIGFNVVTNQKSKTAAKELKTTLQTVRTTAMSKTGTYGCRIAQNDEGTLVVQRVTITKDAGGNPIYNVSEEIELDSRITITASCTTGVVTTDQGIVLGFEKSSGAFKSCTNDVGTDLGTCKELIIKRNSDTVKLKLSASTGKVEIEY
jgi:prepilin-type N-terminal cleavage/methylation domain-containing protein